MAESIADKDKLTQVASTHSCGEMPSKISTTRTSGVLEPCVTTRLGVSPSRSLLETGKVILEKSALGKVILSSKENNSGTK